MLRGIGTDSVRGSSAEFIPERFLLIKIEPGGSDEPTAGLLSALSHAILDDMLLILSR